MTQRTTIRMKGELLAMAKQRAAEQGKTLTDLIEDAVRVELAQKRTRKRVEIPVSSATGGAHPGIDLIKTSLLEDLDDIERYAPAFKK